jgi:hypothetical protein
LISFLVGVILAFVGGRHHVVEFLLSIASGQYSQSPGC